MGVIKVGTLIGVTLGVTAYATLSVIGASLESELRVEPVTNQGVSALEVKPVSVNSFDDLTEPSDIQPALGYKVLQNTSKVQQ